MKSNPLLLKSLLISFLLFGCICSSYGQILSPRTLAYLDTMFVKIQNKRAVNPAFKASSQKLKQEITATNVFNDTIIFYFLKMEHLALQGKARGIWESDMIKKSRRQFPGQTKKAVASRLDLYATRRE